MFHKELAGKYILLFGSKEVTVQRAAVERSSGAYLYPLTSTPSNMRFFLEDVEEGGTFIDGAIFVNPNPKDKDAIIEMNKAKIPTVVVEDIGASDESRTAVAELHAIHEMTVVFALRHHQEGQGLEQAAKKMAKILR